jgi:flagellar basal body-associated protein FliL
MLRALAGGLGRIEETATSRSENMNRIIWLVGLVVIVLFIAGYLGLR